MKNKLLSKLKYFSLAEYLLWGISVIAITLSFAIFDSENVLTFIASLIGVTSLIFNAKGNPFGQVLMIVFSIIYAVISYSFRYYGEMITYALMTAPMAVIALISWLKNPYKGKRSQVQVNSVSKKETVFMILVAIVVTIAFYFILKAFNTANLAVSTLSVTTSFIAVYLTFRRSPFFAIAYALNDIVLICLWIMATVVTLSYFPVVVCFVSFLFNDIYGYNSWKKMQKIQSLGKCEDTP